MSQDTTITRHEGTDTMPTYTVLVRYRTNSGCNAKTLNVTADNRDAAIAAATDKVRRQRGVIRIDGGETREAERAAP